MFAIEVDTEGLTRHLSDVERRQLPFALVGAINETAFETRQAWGEQINRVFDSPTRLTQTSVLYRKATRQTLTAEIFIKDNIGQGTPPSEYLKPEEFGGARRQKAFERRLARSPRARQFYVPGKDAPLDQYGNIRPQLLQRIVSQLQVAEHTPGFVQNESAVGRARRLARQRRRGGGGSYFILPVRRGKLQAGVVYERVVDPATGRSTVRSILYPARSAPRYRARFNALKMAKDIADLKFPAIFKQKLAHAVLTAY